MSSVGPAIAIITNQSEAFVESALQPLGLRIAIRTNVDNNGLSVVHLPK